MSLLFGSLGVSALGFVERERAWCPACRGTTLNLNQAHLANAVDFGVLLKITLIGVPGDWDGFCPELGHNIAVLSRFVMDLYGHWQGS